MSIKISGLSLSGTKEKTQWCKTEGLVENYQDFADSTITLVLEKDFNSSQITIVCLPWVSLTIP